MHHESRGGFKRTGRARSRADRPVARGDSFTTPEDTAMAIAAPGVLLNDSDVDGDPLTAVLVSSPLHGSVTLNADGSYSYAASNNLGAAASTGASDTFTYTAADAHGGAATSTSSRR